MKKYYIKITGRGYLKEITGNAYEGYFSKQVSLSKSFETEAQALCYRGLATKILITKRQEAEKKLDKKLAEDKTGQSWQIRYAREGLKRETVALEKVKKGKFVFIEAPIIFYPKQTGCTSWHHSPKQMKSTSDRIYCNICGGVIPDTKYLRLVTPHGDAFHACPFCLMKVSYESGQAFNNIPEDIKKQYKQDSFIAKL